MSLKYSILATEGTHDQAVLCRLLQLLGLKQFRGERQFLDEEQYKFWGRLIPRSSDTMNIYERLDVQTPRIFVSQMHSIAIYQGGGSSLSQVLLDRMMGYRPYARDIHSLGLVVDADNEQPGKIAKGYADKLSILFPTISDKPGTITVGPPRTGIYVLPDNKRPGTLESILVDCAATIYPDHKLGAEYYLDNLDIAHKAHWKPFDREKAVVSTIVSVIQPGIASHLSLVRAKDKWICETTEQAVPEVARLKQFLVDLLELS